MAEDTRLRRSFSLKHALVPNKLRQGRDIEELQPVERPNKPTLVKYHVTGEDISKRPTAAAPRIPQETRREAWPAKKQSRKPGTYLFDVTPTLVKTPWELERSRRSTRTSTSSDRRPLKAQKVQQLPREVVFCILDQQKLLHCAKSTLNVASYQKDLRALCNMNKHWHRLAREYFYREIWLPGSEEQSKSNIPFRRQENRLKLLLRTLEESPGISDMVRVLRVRSKLVDQLELEACSAVQISKGSFLRTLRDIVSKCRNLEQLSGYAPMAMDSNKEIFDALTSCITVKSHIWRLSPIDYRTRSIDILKYHTHTISWHQLKTLLIWQPVDGFIGPGSISAIVQRLPSLKHLMLKNLSPVDFHNGTLLSLPPLNSLRLEDLHGVTDQGMEQLVHTRLAMSLERLALVGLELTSLQSLQTLLANLQQLRSFSLVQDTSPEIPRLVSATQNNFSLESATIRNLHWDVLARGNSTVVLANSIAAGKFPKLKAVKVPCDNDGAVQKLCRPIVLQPITGQDMAILEEWEQSASYQRSLRVSQIQAQIRVRKERKLPSLKVVIQDEDETTQHTHIIGSYLGNLASAVEYSLEPAVERGGSAIARVEDVLIPGKTKTKGVLGKDEEYMLDLDALF